uniref:Uncharacterized protein n=1 Tax=Oryza sativa subsp. japonica TaxID=39947 RepID=Q10PD8_ORYSJ|nr:hypothetical protein LOC_Os03g13470 [Oryza sativa Japonica Group]
MRQRYSADLLQSEKTKLSRNNKVIFSKNSHLQEVLAPRMLALHQIQEVRLKTIVTRHAPCDAEVNLNRLAKAMGFRKRIANLACVVYGREVSSLSAKKEFRHFFSWSIASTLISAMLYRWTRSERTNVSSAVLDAPLRLRLREQLANNTIPSDSD